MADKDKVDKVEEEAVNVPLDTWRSEDNHFISITKWNDRFGKSYTIQVGRMNKAGEIRNFYLRFLRKADLVAIGSLCSEVVADKED